MSTANEQKLGDTQKFITINMEPFWCPTETKGTKPVLLIDGHVRHCPIPDLRKKPKIVKFLQQKIWSGHIGQNDPHVLMQAKCQR